MAWTNADIAAFNGSFGDASYCGQDFQPCSYHEKVSLDQMIPCSASGAISIEAALQLTQHPQQHYQLPHLQQQQDLFFQLAALSPTLAAAVEQPPSLNSFSGFESCFFPYSNFAAGFEGLDVSGSPVGFAAQAERATIDLPPGLEFMGGLEAMVGNLYGAGEWAAAPAVEAPLKNIEGIAPEKAAVATMFNAAAPVFVPGAMAKKASVEGLELPIAARAASKEAPPGLELYYPGKMLSASAAFGSVSPLALFPLKAAESKAPCQAAPAASAATATPLESSAKSADTLPGVQAKVAAPDHDLRSECSTADTAAWTPFSSPTRGLDTAQDGWSHTLSDGVSSPFSFPTVASFGAFSAPPVLRLAEILP